MRTGAEGAGTLLKGESPSSWSERRRPAVIQDSAHPNVLATYWALFAYTETRLRGLLQRMKILQRRLSEVTQATFGYLNPGGLASPLIIEALSFRSKERK